MGERKFYRWWMWAALGPWLAPAVTLVLCSLAVLLDDLDASARLPLAAVGPSLLFFDQRHRLEASRLLRQVSERCNERYEEQWVDLRDALNSTDEGRTEPYTKYLNLCAEEYLYYSLGLLHPLVWDSWKAGMRMLFTEHQSIREFARGELSGGSYYGFRLDAVGVAESGSRENRRSRGGADD